MVTASKALNRSRGLRVAAGLRRVQEKLAVRFQRSLTVFFLAQAAHAVAVLLSDEIPKAATGGIIFKQLNPNELIPDEDAERLLRIARPYLLQMILASSETTGGLVGTSGLVATDPATLALLRGAGQRIVAINEVTREAVQDVLQEGLARGLSNFEIARGVTERRDAEGNITREAFRGLRETIAETYEGRADTIARTEMALASQEAAEERYEKAGVLEVDVLDGPNCGWTEHDDPDVADSSRRSMDEARRFPIAHPNCRRIFVPIIP